jgi:hypothetical protein
MVSDLRDEMNDAAEIIKRKRMSLAGATYLSNVVLMPRALYRLKLSNATDEQIDRIPGYRVVYVELLRVKHILLLRTLLYYLEGTWVVGGSDGRIRWVLRGLK